MSTPRVFTADGSDLGSMGIVQLLLKLGDKEVVQDFVVCRQLKRDVILGVDFGKQNCAGIEWTTRRTRVLSLNGIPAVEVEENKLGLPVTAAFHVKVPPRHNGVFQVNIHGDTNGTHIISANSQFLEKNPNVYQHEISIITDGTDETFPLIAVTNLDFAKTVHIGKGEIVGFARPEADEVTYIATAKELNMDPYIDNSPRNWIPPRKRVPLEPSQINIALDTSSNNVKSDVLGTLYKYRDDCTRCKIVFRTVLLCACNFCKAYLGRPKIKSIKCNRKQNQS